MKVEKTKRNNQKDKKEKASIFLRMFMLSIGIAALATMASFLFYLFS